MNKKLLTVILSVLAALSLTGGLYAGLSKSDSNDKIASINTQIKAIESSVTDLTATDTQLKGYITTLENNVKTLETQSTQLATRIKALEDDTTTEQLKAALEALQKETDNQIAELNANIAALKEKDGEIEGKITALEILSATLASKDWVNATFATLEQYQAVQTEISAIKANINGINEEISTFKTSTNEKITAIETTIKTLAGKDELASKVTEITQAYTTAIAAATNNITTAYDKAIKDAITASENGMKGWVNDTLAKGYYTIAEIDAELNALKAKDATLTDEVNAQKQALEQAKTDLTAAYEQAISDAISEHNGKITAKIDDINADLTAKINNINVKIADLQSQINADKTDIATIKGQITAINSSINQLKDADVQLKEYITALQDGVASLEEKSKDLDTKIQALDTTSKELKNALEALKQDTQEKIAAINASIKELQNKDAALENRIVALENEAKTLASKDWVNATFATLEQYQAVQTEISAIKASINGINEEISTFKTSTNEKITAIETTIKTLAGKDELASKVTEITQAYTTAISAATNNITTAYDKAIKDAIAASENGMKGWVNDTLTKGYYTIAEIDAELNALKAKDATLTDEVNAQKQALEQAKTDLTAAYEQAISDAISEHNGKITAKIDDINADLTAKINNINIAIEALTSRVSKNESDIKDLISRIEALEKANEDLKKENDELKKQFESMQDLYCLLGKHPYEPTATSWSADFKSLTATFGCKYCDKTLEDITTTDIKYDNLTLTAKFDESYGVTPITLDVSDMTGMTGNQVSAIVRYMVGDGTEDSVDVTLKISSKVMTAEFGPINEVLNELKDGSVNLTLSVWASSSKTGSIGTVLKNNKKLASLTLVDVGSVVDNAFEGSSLTSLTLKNVTTIGKNAFLRCRSLKKIVFSDGPAISLGSYAFNECSALTDISFGTSVTKLSGYTFLSCTSLKEIVIPDHMIYLGSHAFLTCTSLTTVNIGKGLNSAEAPFGGCSSLEEIIVSKENTTFKTIDGNLYKINDKKLMQYALGKKDVSFTLPDEIQQIGDNSFAGALYLKEVILDNGVINYIGVRAFEKCAALTSVTLGNSVQKIKYDAFRSCTSLKNITIPDSVTSVETCVFYGCSALESVTVGKAMNQIWADMIFKNCNKLTSFTVTEPITECGVNVFNNLNTANITLTLAKGQKVLELNTESNKWEATETDLFGGTEFCGCTFKNIVVPHLVKIDATNMSAEDLQAALETYVSKYATNFEITLAANAGSDVFAAIKNGIAGAKDGSVNLTLIGAETIPDKAFYENKKLKSVTLGEGVKTIGESAFIASSLTSVNIGADVKTIGKAAFGFTAITEINIPDNVTTIENAAFYYCGSLTSVTLGKGISEIPYMAFQDCTALKTITIPSNITTVGTLAFAASGLTSVVIPDTVTSLGIAAFSGCKALSNVTIGSGIKSIEAQTFDGCEALKSITIPTTVESIGESSFSGTGLTSVTVPDSVTSLGENAFSACESLTSITIGKGVTNMSKNVFNRDTALTEITFRGVLTEAEYLIFKNVTTSNVTLTLAQGQKVLSGGDNDNPWTASGDDLIYGGTEFCGCTFKQIVLPIEIDTREMSTEQIELAVKTAVENGAIDLTIKFKSNAGVDEFNAAFTAIQLSNWKECLNLTVTGVTEISTTVFYNYGWLKSITFGDGITTLGGEYTVMNFCGSLECATIGKSVTAINGTVFNDCASLEKIVYEGTVAEWNAITKVANWVKECPSVTEVVCSDGTITL